MEERYSQIASLLCYKGGGRETARRKTKPDFQVSPKVSYQMCWGYSLQKCHVKLVKYCWSFGGHWTLYWSIAASMHFHPISPLLPLPHIVDNGQPVAIIKIWSSMRMSWLSRQQQIVDNLYFGWAGCCNISNSSSSSSSSNSSILNAFASMLVLTVNWCTGALLTIFENILKASGALLTILAIYPLSKTSHCWQFWQ